jgi:hypothetical protein
MWATSFVEHLDSSETVGIDGITASTGFRVDNHDRQTGPLSGRISTGDVWNMFTRCSRIDDENRKRD